MAQGGSRPARPSSHAEEEGRADHRLEQVVRERHPFRRDEHAEDAPRPRPQEGEAARVGEREGDHAQGGGRRRGQVPSRVPLLESPRPAIDERGGEADGTADDEHAAEQFAIERRFAGPQAPPDPEADEHDPEELGEAPSAEQVGESEEGPARWNARYDRGSGRSIHVSQSLAGGASGPPRAAMTPVPTRSRPKERSIPAAFAAACPSTGNRSSAIDPPRRARSGWRRQPFRFASRTPNRAKPRSASSKAIRFPGCPGGIQLLWLDRWATVTPSR